MYLFDCLEQGEMLTGLNLWNRMSFYMAWYVILAAFL